MKEGWTTGSITTALRKAREVARWKAQGLPAPKQRLGVVEPVTGLVSGACIIK